MKYWEIFTTPTRRAGHWRTIFALGTLIVVCSITESAKSPSVANLIYVLIGTALVGVSLVMIHREYRAEKLRELKRKRARKKKSVERTLKNPRETILRAARAELSRTRAEREAYYHTGREISVGELARMDQLAAHEKVIQAKIDLTMSDSFGKPRARKRR